LVVWGLPWERRVGKKGKKEETKSDLNHQEIVGARIRDCALPPPPPAMAPNAMGFPHYIDIAGAAFSACAAPIKEITSHTASRPSCCVSISFGTERKRRRMAAALRFMSSARINERKKRMKESEKTRPSTDRGDQIETKCGQNAPREPAYIFLMDSRLQLDWHIQSIIDIDIYTELTFI
jgi:hypothetical protein